MLTARDTLRESRVGVVRSETAAAERETATRVAAEQLEQRHQELDKDLEQREAAVRASSAALDVSGAWKSMP